MSNLVSFIIGVLSISLMVTIHETGHFLFARLSGISVEVYAIGWGKALKKWRSGGTEYRINLFPLGGYCRLKGSEDLQQSLHSGGNEFSNIAPGSLFAISPLKRIPTYIAGPLFNLAFAVILFIPFLMMDYQSYAEPNRIVVSSDHPAVFNQDVDYRNAAHQGGMKSGDVILSIDGEPVSDFVEIRNLLSKKGANSPTRFTIDRDGRTMEFDIVPEYDVEQNRPLFGVTSFIVPTIGTIEELSPESSTSMAVGDTIISVLGKPVTHTVAVMDELSDNPQVLELTLRNSDGIEKTISYIPQKDNRGKNSYGFSFSVPIRTNDGLPFRQAISQAFSTTFSSIRETIQLIPSLFKDSSLQNSLAGPLRISYVIGEMRNSGIRVMLHLLAMVSISLGVANLLPIPGLDGGAILLSLIEFIRGKRVSPKWYVRFQAVGLSFLFFIMILVLLSDLRYFLIGP